MLRNVKYHLQKALIVERVEIFRMNCRTMYDIFNVIHFILTLLRARFNVDVVEN